MENTKKYITSLLTSTPLAVTIQVLNKDYKNTIGEPIPYHKFGFNSLEHFLRSIPDTVRIRGCGPMAEVLPVVSEKSSHVMALVSSQKKNVPKRRDQYYGKRTVVFDHNKQSSQQHHRPPEEQKARIHYPGQSPQSNSGPVEISKPPVYYSVNKTNATSQPPKKIVTDNYPNTTPQLPKKIVTDNYPNTTPQPPQKIADNYTNTIPRPTEKIVTNNYPANTLPAPKKDERINNNIQYSNKLSNDDNQASNLVQPFENLMVANDVPKNDRTIGYSKLGDASKPFAKSHRKKLHHSHHPEKAKPPLSDNSENAVPQSVQSNLRKLIGHYPNGIWCANVPLVYRQMFNRDLRYEDFGFRSLIHLCTSLKSIFHYVRPSSEDFKLYDRSKPLPSSAEKVYTLASYGDGGEKESGTALPNIDWEDVMRFLPPGTFQPGREIPRAFVSEITSENDSIDIKVGEIYDLSKFWVYLDDGMLDALMDDMQVFYNDHAKDYIIPQQLVREGLYCAQLFFGEYHRALVVDIISPPEEMVRIVFIDYGTVAKVPIKDLCFLHEDFSNLPAQAIRCRLANICPPEKGAPWNRESTKAFRQIILQKELTAKITRINWKDQFLEVCLADVTDGNNVYYIHDVLVERGFAIYPNQEQKKSIIDSISTPVVNLIHLFPTFVEIEHGLAPCTSEMEVFHDLNVPINFCYPQYFKFECSEEERIIDLAVAFHEANCVKESRIHSIHSKYIMDKEKLKPDQLDMSYFGQLESDVSACCEYEEDFSESQLDDPEYVEAEKNKTIDKLRQDCLLSQDLMNEILSLCDTNNFSTNDELPDEDSYTMTEEVIQDRNDTPEDVDETGDNYFYTPAQSPSDENVEETVEEDLNDETDFVDDNLGNQEYASYDFQICEISEVQSKELSTESEKSVSAVGKEDETKPVRYSSTNPFLEDLISTAKKESNPFEVMPTLHPNNPFLTYSSADSQDNCSNASSHSTVYEEVKVPQRWSNNDEISDMSVSSFSGSSGSVDAQSAAKNCAISTQTTDEYVESGHSFESYPFNPSPYNGMYVPPFAAPPNWPVGFNNPYYNARFSACGYMPPESRFCPPFPPMPNVFPPRPAICPPPGFAPRNTFSRGSNYIFTVNDIGHRNLNSGPMFNCVSRTATVSNVSVAGERDFYEMYNEQLRLKIRHAPGDA